MNKDTSVPAVRVLSIRRVGQQVNNSASSTTGTSSPSQVSASSSNSVLSIKEKIISATAAKRLDHHSTADSSMTQPVHTATLAAASAGTSSVQSNQQSQIHQRVRPRLETKSGPQHLRRTSSSIEEKAKNDAAQKSAMMMKPSPKLASQNGTELLSTVPIKKPTLKLLTLNKPSEIALPKPIIESSATPVQQQQQQQKTQEKVTSMEIEEHKVPQKATKKRPLSEVVSKEEEDDEEEEGVTRNTLTKKFKKDEIDSQTSPSMIEEEKNASRPDAGIFRSPNQTNDTDEYHTSETSSLNSPLKQNSKEQFVLDATDRLLLAKQQEEDLIRIQHEEAIRNAEAETARVLAQAEAAKVLLEAETALAIQAEQNARLTAEAETARQTIIAEAAQKAAARAITDAHEKMIADKNARMTQQSDVLKQSITSNMSLIEAKREQILKMSAMITERLSPEALAVLKQQARKQSKLIFPNKKHSKVNMRILDCVLKSNVKFLDNLRV